MQVPFENWDFVDPKIIQKFEEINSYTKSLQEESKSMTNKEFLSFKDKARVEKSVERLNKSIKTIVEKQKSQLIDYFDKQLEHNSKRSNPNDSSTYSIKFTMSSRSRTLNRGEGSTVRSHSEHDIPSFFRRPENRQKQIEEYRAIFGYPPSSGRSGREQLSTSNTLRGRLHNQSSILPDTYASNSTRNQEPESEREEENAYDYGDHAHSEYLVDDISETERKVRPRPIDSIFTLSHYACDTDYTSTAHSKKGESLFFKKELAAKDKELQFYKRYYFFHHKRITNGNMKGAKAFARRQFRGHIREKIVRRGRKEINYDLKLLKLRKALTAEKAKNEKLAQGIKRMSQIVVTNQDLISQMTKNQNNIQKELLKTKEYQAILMDNFSQFKAYIEKILGDFSKKLIQYNEKEQAYNEVVEENTELKKKCRELIETIKVISQSKSK